MSIVDVETILQRIGVARELVATAHDIKIRVSIAVRVEEDRVDVLREAVAAKRRLLAGLKRSVGALDIQSAGLPFRAAEVDVVESIAVHVSDGDRRTFRGQDV